MGPCVTVIHDRIMTLTFDLHVGGRVYPLFVLLTVFILFLFWLNRDGGVFVLGCVGGVSFGLIFGGGREWGGGGGGGGGGGEGYR